MKTTVITLAAILGLAIGTGNLSNAAAKDESGAVVLKNVSRVC